MKVYLTGWIYRNKTTQHCAIYRGIAAPIHGKDSVVLEDLDRESIMFVVIPVEEFTEGWEEHYE
jgi:hypothetical protein